MILNSCFDSKKCVVFTLKYKGTIITTSYFKKINPVDVFSIS